MLKYTDTTIGQLLAETARRQPDHDFIVYPDRALRWSWGEFNQRVDRFAKGLLALGIGKGDHIGIWARNVPDWLTLLFASARIGAVLVTVNTAYKSHEVAYVLEQSDMKALFLIDSFRDINYIEIIYELVPELRRANRGELHSERFPFLRTLVYLGPEKHRGMYNTNEVFLLGGEVDDASLAAAAANVFNEEVTNMQYTSGTTGFPKGVMLTHRNIMNNGFSIGECMKYTEADRLCLPVPLFHCFGIVLGIMSVLTHGSTVVMLEVFDPLLALAAVHKERCTSIYGVPTMFIAELEHPMFGMFDLTSLRTGIMAGSPCPIERMRQCVERMHMRDITSVYGLTEASPGMTQTRTDDPLEKKVGTVGRPFPDIEVRVIDPETGEDCPTDVPGEVVCRGYNSMKGYYKMPEETARIIDQDGWLHSGDIGAFDSDGFLRITGRLKDMIIRGGENIYPKEIEEFVNSVPGVLDTQVVGVPDTKYGEVVGAFVILKPGADLTPEDIQDYARPRIARYKVPKHVFLVKEFPLTASGKIQKYRLRDMAKELLKVQTTVFDAEKE